MIISSESKYFKKTRKYKSNSNNQTRKNNNIIYKIGGNRTEKYGVPKSARENIKYLLESAINANPEYKNLTNDDFLQLKTDLYFTAKKLHNRYKDHRKHAKAMGYSTNKNSFSTYLITNNKNFVKAAINDHLLFKLAQKQNIQTQNIQLIKSNPPNLNPPNLKPVKLRPGTFIYKPNLNPIPMSFSINPNKLF